MKKQAAQKNDSGVFTKVKPNLFIYYLTSSEDFQKIFNAWKKEGALTFFNSPAKLITMLWGCSNTGPKENYYFMPKNGDPGSDIWYKVKHHAHTLHSCEFLIDEVTLDDVKKSFSKKRTYGIPSIIELTSY